jgi:hypothetical protein
MMGVDPATMAAAVSAEAYLNLARYSGLLDRGSVSIAPVGGSSAGTSKASGQVKIVFVFLFVYVDIGPMTLIQGHYDIS